MTAAVSETRRFGGAVQATASSTTLSRVREEITKATGLTADLSERGLGIRSQRYAMVIDDGVVKALNIEDTPGKADISGADNLMKSL